MPLFPEASAPVQRRLAPKPKRRAAPVAAWLLAATSFSLAMGVYGFCRPASRGSWTPEKASELDAVWNALHRSTERAAPPPDASPGGHSELSQSQKGGEADRHGAASNQQDGDQADALRRRYFALAAELEQVRSDRVAGGRRLGQIGLAGAVLFGLGYLVISRSG